MAEIRSQADTVQRAKDMHERRLAVRHEAACYRRLARLERARGIARERLARHNERHRSAKVVLYRQIAHAGTRGRRAILEDRLAASVGHHGAVADRLRWSVRDAGRLVREARTEGARAQARIERANEVCAPG